jgi:hypothetical protein
MTTELQRLVDDLQTLYDAQSEVKRDLARKLDEAKQALHNSIPMDDKDQLIYEEKLGDMKQYVSKRLKHPCDWTRVSWTFRKYASAYRDDFGNIVADPLDIAVAEYDLLHMGSHIDVRIDVHQENVKRFVQTWMAAHMAGSLYENNLFAFN